uniref:Uncharacterized protein n=1 Tax=Aegilops tauschii subsp. strangulata TaxID=200361 RepID=A0A453L0T0_AEGTS
MFFATVELDKSWDVIKAGDVWEDDDDNGYVLVKPEDAAEGIAFFVATYLSTLTKTKVGMPCYFHFNVILSSPQNLCSCSLIMWFDAINNH